MGRDYQQMALDMLGSTLSDPPTRAIRISGLYASLYLEDPFLFRWFGLACFVSRQIHQVLSVLKLPITDQLKTMLADGNLAIYSTMVPATLAYRDRQPIQGPLQNGFETLKQADLLGGTDEEAAETLAKQALLELCDIEQRQIVQPFYDTLPQLTRDILDQVFIFRMGYDTAAPVLKFKGDDAANADQRCDWMLKEVLPTFDDWRRHRTEWLRADCDRMRRWAEVKLGDLPGILKD